MNGHTTGLRHRTLVILSLRRCFLALIRFLMQFCPLAVCHQFIAPSGAGREKKYVSRERWPNVLNLNNLSGPSCVIGKNSLLAISVACVCVLSNRE